tara:strand:+ start:5569 stop:6111 length:543 start_codon:yes stop_codon:yes gene_type:complete
MSCCNTLTEIPQGCENNIGGVKKIYIINKCEVSGTTANGGIVVSAGTITTLDVDPGAAFVEYVFNKNTSSYVEDGTISLENGSTFFSTTTSLMIPRREAAKRNSLALLAAGQPNLMVILEDGNGIYWLQGLDNGANLTALGEGSGVAKADGSKYSVTLLSEEPEMMYEVSSTVMTSLGLI